MPIIVEIVEERKDETISYGTRNFQPVRVVTYHLPDEALLDDDDGDGDFLQTIGVEDDRFERAIIAETVRKLVASAGLTEKERAILQATFWDDDDDAAIAKRLKLSVSRIKQLRRAALAKLRFLAREWGLI